MTGWTPEAVTALITSVTGIIVAIGTVVGLFFHNINHPPTGPTSPPPPPASTNGQGSDASKPG